MQPEGMTEDRAGGTPARNESRPGNAQAHRHSTSLWAGSLDAWVCTLNIERFREQLERTTDEGYRTILTTLIAEHAARLERSQRSSAL